MPGLVNACRDAEWGQVHRDTELLEEVGGSARRRRRPVAVLDDPAAGRGDDDRRHGGDVHGVCAVAARPAGVDRGSGNVDAGGMPEHGRDQAGTSAAVSPLARSATTNPAS